MIRIYCDRCRKQRKDEPFKYSSYDRAQNKEVGSYLPNILKVVEDKNETHDYVPVDLCNKCEKELEEIVFNFMNSK